MKKKKVDLKRVITKKNLQNFNDTLSHDWINLHVNRLEKKNRLDQVPLTNKYLTNIKIK